MKSIQLIGGSSLLAVLFCISKVNAIPDGCRFQNLVYSCPASNVRIQIRNTQSDPNWQFTDDDIQKIVALLSAMPTAQLQNIPYIESVPLRNAPTDPIPTTGLAGVNKDGGLFFRIDNATFPIPAYTDIDRYLPDAFAQHVYETMLTPAQRAEWSAYVAAENSAPVLLGLPNNFLPEDRFVSEYTCWINGSDDLVYGGASSASVGKSYLTQMMLFMASVFADPSSHSVLFYGNDFQTSSVPAFYNGNRLTLGPVSGPGCVTLPCGTYTFSLTGNQISSIQLPSYNPFVVADPFALPSSLVGSLGFGQGGTLAQPPQVAPASFTSKQFMVSPRSPNASYVPCNLTEVQKLLSPNTIGRSPNLYSAEHGITPASSR